MPTISVVKGISGSGKSSRVFQLIKFFQNFGFSCENFYHNGKLVGLMFNELNLLFIGKIYKSGTIERWQGYDSVTSVFGSSENFSLFLGERNGFSNIIIEGAGVTQTNRLRPEFLFNELEFKKIYIQYYNYPSDGLDVYMDRIRERSGEKKVKDTMWKKNKSFRKEFRKSIIEKNNIGSKNIFIYDSGFMADIDDFGIKFLSIMDLKNLIIEFCEFCTNFDYISKNKYENF